MSNLIQQAHDLHVALLDILRRMDLPDDDAYNDYHRDQVERMLEQSDRRVTRRIAAALAEARAEVRAQALREAAEVAEAWGAGDTRNSITPVEFDRRYGVHLHLAAAIRALTSLPPSGEAPRNHSPATRP
jgi:hypothetical protein